jgi:hypothetical protein
MTVSGVGYLLSGEALRGKLISFLGFHQNTEKTSRKQVFVDFAT